MAAMAGVFLGIRDYSVDLNLGYIALSFPCGDCRRTRFGDGCHCGGASFGDT